MGRVFEVRTTHKHLVGDLGKALCQRIMDIQQNGWKIHSITPVDTVEYDEELEEWFESTVYVIIATQLINREVAPMREAKFKTGQIVCTRGVDSKMKENGEFYCFVLSSLYAKYLQCDWGDTCEEDSKANDAAVESGDERIFAIYKMNDHIIWIITEWDRSVTTVLFPDEY